MFHKELLQMYKHFLYDKIIIFDFMVKLGNNLYKQDFYCTDFFILNSVLEREIERLTELGISLDEWRFSIGRETPVIFYLTLYFSSIKGEPLYYEDVYGDI